MSIYKNGKLVAGGSQALPLLCFMWSDHQLNHPSWLNSTTFSWQSGAVYQAVYTHLSADITGKTLQSETISGTTIQFYLADDGHKICPASQESNVTAIYNATGVAWYYIIDTTNQRFKLPRTKFGFTGIRSGVGGYVEAGLPNINGNLISNSANYVRGMLGFDANGALQVAETSTSTPFEHNGWDGWGCPSRINLDASRSSSIYGNSDTVQPKATEMYLYFYVGQFTQTALGNTAGLNAELFAEKIDLNGNNAAFAHIVETYNDGNNWYRVYSDGWCEQGGLSKGGGGSFVTTTFLKPFVDTSYNIVTALLNDENNSTCFGVKIANRTASSFQSRTWYSSGNAGDYNFNWRASGYIA